MDSTDKVVMSLCDRTGIMVEPWAEAGYTCLAVDVENDGHTTNYGDGIIGFVQADVTKWLPPRAEYEAAFAFPPCDDLAVSGARWFKQKGLQSFAESVAVVEECQRRLAWADCPWLLENPVSTLSTYWREPDYTFHPYEYDGYTDADNRYSKKTCLWTGGGFKMPETAPADDYDDRIHKMPPSEERSQKRAETPRGFAEAVYEVLSHG